MPSVATLRSSTIITVPRFPEPGAWIGCRDPVGAFAADTLPIGSEPTIFVAEIVKSS